MIEYQVMQHPSGNYRIQQNLNGVLSFVNKGKQKYFKLMTEVLAHMHVLKSNNNRKAALAKNNKHLLVNI
jgi:hypothetical protein